MKNGARERERTLFDSKLDLLDSGFIFTSSPRPFITTGYILLHACMLKGNRKTTWKRKRERKKKERKREREINACMKMYKTPAYKLTFSRITIEERK